MYLVINLGIRAPLSINYHFRRILVHFLPLNSILRIVSSPIIFKIVSISSSFFYQSICLTFNPKKSPADPEINLPQHPLFPVLRQNEWRRRAAICSTPSSSSQLSHSVPLRSSKELRRDAALLLHSFCRKTGKRGCWGKLISGSAGE